MGLEEDILKLLKAEGYKINEHIKAHLDEFLDAVNEENESMEENDEVGEDVEDD